MGRSKGNSCGVLFNPKLKKPEDAHRVSWRLFNQPKNIDDKYVTQDCGNRLCVNPEHLSLSDRRKTGVSHPQAKLNDDIVREVRAINSRNAERKNLKYFADKFGVSRETIRKVAQKLSSGTGSLTESQVKEIHRDYRMPENYEKFLDAGISKGAIQAVLSGRTWQHVK